MAHTHPMPTARTAARRSRGRIAATLPAVVATIALAGAVALPSAHAADRPGVKRPPAPSTPDPGGLCPPVDPTIPIPPTCYPYLAGDHNPPSPLQP